MTKILYGFSAVLSSVNVSTASGMLVSKNVGMTSHVPRGLAAGASLAVRPVTPTASQGVGAQGMTVTQLNTTNI